MQSTTNITRTRRAIWIAIGTLCVALGTVGIFVPGLPTTVFLLLASWCFSKSSPRLYRKLHAHPQLGRYLEMARGRHMPLRARAVSIVAMWAGIGVALLFGSHPTPLLRVALLAAGMTGTTAVLLVGRWRFSGL